MTETHNPSSPADCLRLLAAVLTCLDNLSAADKDQHAVALAAVRVQEAMDLIGNG